MKAKSNGKRPDRLSSIQGTPETAGVHGEKIPLLESLCAIGIGGGKLLQIFCQQQGYVGEEKMKAILCNSLKMSFDYYKENHSSEINDRLGQTCISVYVVKSLLDQ